MAEPVRARGLTEQEGPKLQQIVRPGNISSIRYLRAATQLASANGSRVLLIAQLGADCQDVAPYRGDEAGLADCGHGHDARLEDTQPYGRPVVAGLSVRTGCGQLPVRRAATCGSLTSSACMHCNFCHRWPYC